RKINTVLNLTSEAPLEAESKNGGIFARVIEYGGSVFGKHDHFFKDDVMDVIFENYGLPGRVFVEYLMKHTEEKNEWRIALRNARREALNYFKEKNIELDDKVTRKINYFTATLIAGQLAKKALNLPIDEEQIISTVKDCLIEQVKTSDSSPYYEK